MAYISTVTLPGSDDKYNISAASAGIALSANKLSNTIDISATGDVEWKVSFDGSSSVSGKATIKHVPTSAISEVPWSAVSALIGDISTTAKTGFAAPSAVANAIASAISNVYQIMGTTTCESLTSDTFSGKVNGYVYNISNSGQLPATASLEGIDLDINAGDNVVYVAAGRGGWDKLASTLSTSAYVTKTELTDGSLSANFSALSATTISGTISNYSSISSHVFNEHVTSWSALSASEFSGSNPISVNTTFSAISSLHDELTTEFAGDLSALNASALSAEVSANNLKLFYVKTPIIIPTPQN